MIATVKPATRRKRSIYDDAPDQQPENSEMPYKVGDLLGTSDGFLALVEQCSEEGVSILVSNGKRLTGTLKDFERWHYQKLWSEGDRITPKHNPGSRYGTITGFNLRNKKTPLLIRFDDSQTDGKWGKDAVIAVDSIQSASNEASEKPMETELKVGDRVQIFKFPGGSQWLGMSGVIKDFEGKGTKTQALLTLDDDEGGLWVSKNWIKLAQQGTEQDAANQKCSDSTFKVGALTTQSSEVIDVELLPSRSEQLAQCEARLEAAIDRRNEAEEQIWIEVYTIRNQELWKESEHKNFEEYCKHRWGWEKSNAHEKAGAGEVVLQLKESGAAEVPTSVAAIRPLRKLQPEQRLQVIKRAKGASGKLTAEAVKLAILEIVHSHPSHPLTVFKKGDFVEGVDDGGKPHQGYVAAVGVGYLRLEDNVAVYNPKAATPTLECPDTWKTHDRMKAAGAKFREQEIPKAELPNPWPDSRSDSAAEDLDDQERALLHQLKQIAQHSSDGIYSALCKLMPDADLNSLVDTAEEINTAIAEILEISFLGD